MFKLTFLRLIVIQFIKQFLVKVRPLFKSESRSVYARRDVKRNHRSLYENSSGAAHRVNQVALSVPPRNKQQTSGKHFVYRSLGLTNSVASLMQRFARAVKRNCALVVSNMNANLNIRVINTDRRTLVAFLAEMVSNSIFHLIRKEFGVFEYFGINHGVNRKSFRRVQIQTPVQLLNLVVHIISILRLKFKYRFQNTQSGTATKVRLVQHFQITLEGNAATQNFDVICAQIDKFLRQNLFQPLECFGYHFKFFFAHENKVLIICKDS